MNQFMIDISLPKEMTDEFIGLIPAQRAQVNKLMLEGTISAYSLSLDRSKLWVTMAASTEKEIESILATFPLRKFMEFDIHPLMFHQSSVNALARISMN